MDNSSTTIGKLLSHFNVERPGDIVWTHAVNDRKTLEQVCKSPNIMMVEGDISCVSKTEEIVMAHPPRAEHTQTLEEWLREIVQKPKGGKLYFDEWFAAIIKCGKGTKLDFKDPRTVVPCLKILQTMNGENTVPVLLSADVLQGPGGSSSLFKAEEFVSVCKQFYPDAILSLGWMTGYTENGKYERELFEEILNITKLYEGPVTITLRACFLQESHEEIKWLLENTDHILTIWNNEIIPDDVLEWMQNEIGYQRVFYDLDTDPDLPMR